MRAACRRFPSFAPAWAADIARAGSQSMEAARLRPTLRPSSANATFPGHGRPVYDSIAFPSRSYISPRTTTSPRFNIYPRQHTTTCSFLPTQHPPCPPCFQPLPARSRKPNVAFLRAQRRSFSLAASSAKADVLGLTWPSAAVLPEVDFKVASTAPLEFSGDLLVLGLFESAVRRDDKGVFESIQDPALSSLDEALGGVIAELASEPEFKGKAGQKSSLYRLLGQPFKRLALVGLGPRASLATAEVSPWQSVGASIAALAKQSNVERAALAIIPSPPEPPKEEEGGKGEEKAPAEETPASRGEALGAVARGVILESFQDVRFKSEDTDKEKAGTHVKEVTFLITDDAAAEEQLFKAVRVAAGTLLTRELVNAPPNVLTPEVLAKVAEDLAASHSDVLSAEILSKEECEALGMGSYLAVAAASANPPKFIHLTYSPPKSDGDPKKLAIIGKGLTFDSGGYNLKAGAGSMIEKMKFDMGGAAATLGAAKAVAAIQPEGVEVHFIIAACENMISGTGLRPGDIITASNGKTIEVNNTDAEGRLTLADALVFASKLKVHKIVDIATLTGACIVALGNDVAGLFTPSDELAADLASASKATGEKVWRMPMEEAYWEGMKSSVADMVNTGPREGGSITASLFLKQYVDKDIPWAHLDIAGPVWNYKKSEGTGYAASLLYKWVEQNAS